MTTKSAKHSSEFPAALANAMTIAACSAAGERRDIAFSAVQDITASAIKAFVFAYAKANPGKTLGKLNEVLNPQCGDATNDT